ncbi:MAG: SUMF1/EgtB/PvdO family nonheme iron enzyme [Flavobacteriales bacterium]|nr:MAG: SUMF1/EgtB/PvdO family nonheme iron enzyme [Flavobacteriales bacterium]
MVTVEPFDLMKGWLTSVMLAFYLLPSAMAQSARDFGLYAMERINDSTFIDCEEMSVGEMISFAKEHPDMAMPDPTVIRDLPYGLLFYGDRTGSMSTVKGLTRMYRSISATVPSDSVTTKAQRIRARRFMDYPIAGITYEQAMAYCAWRTKNHGEYQRVEGEVEFQLPTPEEYERLLGIRDSTNGRCAVFNYNCQPCHKQLNGKRAFLRPGSELTPVQGYLPDTMNLYNMRGNAAEMTSTPGIAKGGSYAHPASEASPNSVQHYHKPEAWLGFRCVARVRKK